MDEPSLEESLQPYRDGDPGPEPTVRGWSRWLSFGGICAILALGYFGYILIASSLGGINGPVGRDQEATPSRDTGSAMGDGSLPPEERANTTQVIEGTVERYNDPSRPRLNYQIVTDSGRREPVALTELDGEVWVGREVRATVRYGQDGIRFDIIRWQAAP